MRCQVELTSRFLHFVVKTAGKESNIWDTESLRCKTCTPDVTPASRLMPTQRVVKCHQPHKPKKSKATWSNKSITYRTLYAVQHFEIHTQKFVNETIIRFIAQKCLLIVTCNFSFIDHKMKILCTYCNVSTFSSVRLESPTCTFKNSKKDE